MLLNSLGSWPLIGIISLLFFEQKFFLNHSYNKKSSIFALKNRLFYIILPGCIY
jgi:lipid-A-disaccharide synthase-like uncharacterized protein